MCAQEMKELYEENVVIGCTEDGIEHDPSMRYVPPLSSAEIKEIHRVRDLVLKPTRATLPKFYAQKLDECASVVTRVSVG